MKITENQDGFYYKFCNGEKFTIRFHPTYTLLEHQGFESYVLNHYDCESIIKIILLKAVDSHYFLLSYPYQSEFEKILFLKIKEHWAKYSPPILERISSPTILKVHKKFNEFQRQMQSTYIPGYTPPAIFFEGFYEVPYLIKYILKYPACSIAVEYLNLLLRYSFYSEHLEKYKTKMSTVWAEEELDIRLYKIERNIPTLVYFEKHINAGLDNDIISCLESWRKLFSITERVSRALNKTLSNLSDTAGSNSILEFSNYSLVRPILNRLEIAVSSAGYDSRHSKIFMHAKEDRIMKALSLYSQHIRGVAVDSFLSLISEFVEFLDKFPDIHNGNIVGLTEKAIKWQEKEKDKDVMKLFCKYDETDKTSIPQFKLCENENIHFLSSAVDIVQEGVTMKHCVTKFIDDAIEGNSFYYHVNFNEESATAELDEKGRLVQINGPKNKTNTAVDFGSTFFLNSNNFVNPPVKMVCDRWQLSLFE